MLLCYNIITILAVLRATIQFSLSIIDKSTVCLRCSSSSVFGTRGVVYVSQYYSYKILFGYMHINLHTK